jgi:hypothetical protein
MPECFGTRINELHQRLAIHYLNSRTRTLGCLIVTITMPKFAVLVGASAEAEKGKMPTVQDLSEMLLFNEQLRKAGVLLDADGFLASSKGARVNFSADAPPKAEYGPFGLKDLVAGYWFWKLDTLEQAIEWAGKIPFKEGRVEIRQVAGEEDFGAETMEALNKKKEELRGEPKELSG